ncbi:hypothetical protein Tco_0990783 [Tanacetum coccineum]|uniref:Uncharacterized protein n=1 Tax=Tanacetum coccineum TaxID=301880 RepID=A0ABQ5EXP4_9ASTR
MLWLLVIDTLLTNEATSDRLVLLDNVHSNILLTLELNRINDDLFTYEIKVPQPTPCDEQRTSNPTYNDLGEYEWKMIYEDCEKIYTEAVIFITKRLIRLIDVTVEQWLDLKYGDHKTMDKKCQERGDCWKDDGYCNGGNLPGAFRVGNMLRYQDLEWYEALEDGKLKDEALQNKAIMERVININKESCDEAWRRWDDYENTIYNDEEMEPKDGHSIGNLDYNLVRDNASNHTNNKEEEHKERCNLFDNTARDAPVCKIRRFEMIKYSFGHDEEYVAIKECEYDDMTKTNEDACRAYQEIFCTEYGVSTSIGYGVSNFLSNIAYSFKLINMAYPLPWDTAYRSSVTETEILCMTRSSINKLFTPYKEPEREFQSSRRHFKSLSLEELRSPDFNLLSDQEYSEEEEAEAMIETMEQYISKTRIDYGSGVARPKIDNKDQFELKGQFLKEIREKRFSGSDNEDANEHIEKVLEIVDLFHVPNITEDQLML